MQKNSVYFPNLNGLRFIAALMVFVYHVEQNSMFFGLPNVAENIILFGIGKLGVVLFFVLSGFLITYILLHEEQIKGRISIPKFYLRRVLRIWPLYFFVLILAFFILPNIAFFVIPGFEKPVLYENFTLKAIMYFTFFANLAVSMFNVFPYASQTWSIGTEEQFYLVWPLLIAFVRKRRLLFILGVIAAYIGVYFLLNSNVEFIPGKMYLRKFWKLFNIDCMAIGAVFAVMLHTKRFLTLFLNNTVFYIALIAAVGMMGWGISVLHVNLEVYSILFGIIILNFAANKNIGLSMEFRIPDYLGKISYGLYMYHSIAIVAGIKLMLLLNFSPWILYIAAFVLTVAIASLSYELFEKKFIRLKAKYSDVVSGENAKQATVLAVPVNTVHSHSESHYSSHPGYTAEQHQSPALRGSGTDAESAV